MSIALEHSPAHVLQALLIDLGLGTSPADGGSWPIFVANEPDTPDSVITLVDTAGVKDGRSMIDGEVSEHHGVQITIRDASHSLGFIKARAITRALDEEINYSTITLDAIVGTSTDYYTVYAVSRNPIISLGTGPTPSDRHFFTINATISLKQTA